MKTVYIYRDKFYHGQASLGTCLVLNEQGERIFKSASLERGWLDNQNMISCVPVGDYKLRFEWSPKFKQKLWELYGVPNRRECKFHTANYWWQLNGCIALGRFEKFIDGDNVLDVAYSADTMQKFHQVLEWDEYAVLKIRNLRYE